jgi:hypothetical protein
MKKILTVLIIIIIIVSCDRRTQIDYSWHSTPTVNNRTLYNYTPRPIVNRSVQRVLPNRRLTPKRFIITRSKVTKRQFITRSNSFSISSNRSSSRR